MQKLQRWLWIAAVLSAALNTPAQSRRVKDLAVGKLLVAPRDARDPSFARTVILLVQHDGQSAVGLMVNRRTKIPISLALGAWKPAKDKSDPVYMGGPVELNGVLALLRLASKPDDAAHVVGDVYLASSRTPVEKALAAGTGPGEFRVYLGYCGWGAGQLENEVELGAWYIFSGNAGLVFDSDPASLWSRLIARTEQQIVRNLAPKRGACCFAIRQRLVHAQAPAT
ncbi:MAG: YqgE/AlgH family protein [Bryobacteraceae bacterium]